MATGYKVTNVEHATWVAPGGHLIEGMQVTFESATSHASGFVRLPMNAFTPELVNEAITGAVATLDAVAAL